MFGALHIDFDESRRVVLSEDVVEGFDTNAQLLHIARIEATRREAAAAVRALDAVEPRFARGFSYGGIANVDLRKLVGQAAGQFRKWLIGDVTPLGRDGDDLTQYVADASADIDTVRIDWERKTQQEPKVLDVA